MIMSKFSIFYMWGVLNIWVYSGNVCEENFAGELRRSESDGCKYLV